MKLGIGGGSESHSCFAKDPQKTLFLSKPKVADYIFVKNPYYENLKLEKHGYNELFREDCFEWFVRAMLEI